MWRDKDSANCVVCGEEMASWDQSRSPSSFRLIKRPGEAVKTMTKRRKRPRDPLQLAKLIGDIATGQAEDPIPTPAQVKASKAGKAGGRARSVALTPQQKSDIARAAASARWKKN
jgi:hypothetical protein